MRFPGIKCNDHALALEVDFYILYAVDFHQDGAQLAHAFLAIFAFSCDLDCFQNSVVGAFREKRIGWIGIVWSRRVHSLSLSNARQWRCGRLSRHVMLSEAKHL
jgi:hypothetical protein